jgi:Ca2+-binding EF-hand superfamily protein
MGCGTSKHIEQHFTPNRREGQGQSVVRLAEELGLTKHELDVLYRLFQHYDADGGGSISLEEFIIGAKLDICDSFCRIVFRLFDDDGSGQMSFEEFVKSVWGLCTCTTPSLGVYTFTLFDLDNSGSLSSTEVQFMCSLLHDFKPSKNVATALQQIGELLEKNETTDLSLEDFLQEVHHAEVLLMPATEMQLLLMRQTLGEGPWKRHQDNRTKNFGLSSIFDILQASKSEATAMKVRGLSKIHAPSTVKIDSIVKKKLDKAKLLRDAELKRNKAKSELDELRANHEKNNMGDISNRIERHSIHAHVPSSDPSHHGHGHGHEESGTADRHTVPHHVKHKPEHAAAHPAHKLSSISHDSADHHGHVHGHGHGHGHEHGHGHGHHGHGHGHGSGHGHHGH